MPRNKMPQNQRRKKLHSGRASLLRLKQTPYPVSEKEAYLQNHEIVLSLHHDFGTFIVSTEQIPKWLAKPRKKREQPGPKHKELVYPLLLPIWPFPHSHSIFYDMHKDHLSANWGIYTCQSFKRKEDIHEIQQIKKKNHKKLISKEAKLLQKTENLRILISPQGCKRRLQQQKTTNQCS